MLVKDPLRKFGCVRFRLSVCCALVTVAITACEPVSVDHTPSTLRSASTTTSAVPFTPSTEPMPHFTEPGAAPFESILSIPASGEGVTYRRTADGTLNGPAAFSAAFDGTFWIADTLDHRILHTEPNGDLIAQFGLSGSGSILDITTTPDGFWVLDVDVASGLHQILRFDVSGTLIRSHQLPPGMQLQDGLSGIWAGDSDLWLEFEGGQRLFRIDGDATDFNPEPVGSYTTDQLSVALLGNRLQPLAARVEVEGTVVEVPIREAGGAAYEGEWSGLAAIQIDDAAQSPDGRLDVNVLVLWVGPRGEVLGHGTYPLDDVAYVPEHFLSVGEGRILALVPGADGVSIVELSMFPGSPQG
jgi:hypothetical protein